MASDSQALIRKQKQLLSCATPRIPEKKLRAYVEKYFDSKRRYLDALVHSESPLYLLDPEVLETKAREFKAAFHEVFPETSYYFAVKSNNHPDVAKILLREGFGLDVSSGEELEMALRLGATDIVFSGPGKTERELALAVNNWEKVTLLIDSFGELRRVAGIAAERDHCIRCGVRLSVSATGLWRKFGIPLLSLPDFWGEAQQHPQIQLRGLQFHTSWNLSPERQVAFVEEVGDVLQEMPTKFRKNLEFVDIGGGYWPEQGEWMQTAGTPEGGLLKILDEDLDTSAHYWQPADRINIFAVKISNAVYAHLFRYLPKPCRICFEPGRWLCHDAMHLLMTVVDKKGSDIIITDAGTNAVGWERFETDYFPVLNLSRPALNEKRCLVLGSLCTPHDVWGYAYFGQGIEPGDVLMIPSQGAYTYSLRQHFIKPLPRVTMI